MQAKLHLQMCGVSIARPTLYGTGPVTALSIHAACERSTLHMFACTNLGPDHAAHICALTGHSMQHQVAVTDDFFLLVGAVATDSMQHTAISTANASTNVPTHENC